MCMMKRADHEEEVMILREEWIKKMEKIKIEPKVFGDDLEWVSSHYSELMQKHPNHWVTLVNKEAWLEDQRK